MTSRTMASALALMAGALIVVPSDSRAAFVDFSGNGTGADLGVSTTTIGGIQVQGFENNSQTNVTLSRAARVNDRGIGVCGTTDSAGVCGGGSWSGDTDEIDNLNAQESVRLTPQGGLTFTGEFALSSLDTGGSPIETGYVTWAGGSVQFSPNGAIVISGATSATLSPWAAYPGETNNFLLTIVGGGILNASNVTFFSGCLQGSCGTNNDYLVAGAGVVPVPAALPLFLSALAGLGVIGRRKS